MINKKIIIIAAGVGLICFSAVMVVLFCGLKKKGNQDYSDLAADSSGIIEGEKVVRDRFSGSNPSKDGLQDFLSERNPSEEESGQETGQEETEGSDKAFYGDPEDKNGELDMEPAKGIEEENGKTSMVALAENEAEARHIAELYGMEFVDFSYGVATYLTDQDPQELMEMGEKNRYPSISINHKVYLN